MKQKILDFLSSCADVILPALCVNCGAEISGPRILCLHCFKSIIIRKSPRKIGSKLLFAATNYNDPAIGSLIKAMKYTGIWKAGEPLSDIILKHLEISGFTHSALGESESFIIPIPIHFFKQWQRGFNQSEILANMVGQKIGIPVVSALKRHGWSLSQSKLQNDRTRLLNIKDCFSLARAASTIPQKSTLILLDDVVTSGETIKEAARTLKPLLPSKIIFISVASR